jgi:hypothetical protein
LSKNDPLVEQRLMQKYGGLSFCYEEFDIFFDLLSSNMQFKYQRKSSGWMVVGTHPEYISDGSDDNLIKGYLIDEELIGMVVERMQPTAVTIIHPIGGKR